MEFNSITNTFKEVKVSKLFTLYTVLYGATGLVVPLAVQFLVNNLALSGLWSDIVTFLSVIGLGLLFLHLFKFSQIILLEYAQREVFYAEIIRWKNIPKAKAHYYFEIVTLVKSYAKAFSNVIEASLVVLIGLFTIILFHPGFILLPILIFSSFYFVWKNSYLAIKTSIEESNQKYLMYDSVVEHGSADSENVTKYMSAREGHFTILKRCSLIIFLANFLCQFILLAMGIFLIESSQLSVGQLVSAEIIFSGISAALIKLPETLESFYDFETSKYKLKHVLDLGDGV